jgi:hypothetical protein
MPSRVLFIILVSMAAIVAACTPAEPPTPVEEAPPPPPPPPPPTLYDIGEVDIVEAEPGFTSRNVTFMGVRIGDITNDMLDVLGDQTGDTQNSVEHYVSSYKNGGLIIYTFKSTGEIRQIEVLTRLASEVVSPQLADWLRDGDVDAMRELMGPEEYIDGVAETGATEYAYDARGIRFISYEDQRGLKFSYYRD